MNNGEWPLKIDCVRKKGFRPQAVGCFLHDNKVFMFFDEKYGIWQFPQGGIENKEEPTSALEREMSEELGEKFVGQAEIENTQLIAQKSIMFPKEKHASRELIDDNGNRLVMKGKWYYFFAVPTTASSFDEHLKNSEFNDWKLVGYDDAKKTAQTIYQKGKQRSTLEILKILQENGLIE